MSKMFQKISTKVTDHFFFQQAHVMCHHQTPNAKKPDAHDAGEQPKMCFVERTRFPLDVKGNWNYIFGTSRKCCGNLVAEKG